MAKLKILMSNYEFPPIGGGAAKANLCILKQYAQNPDLKVDLLTSAPKPGFIREQFADNITIYKVGIHKKNLHYWRKVEVLEWLFKAGKHHRRLLRENDYDLAHAFFAFPTAWLCYKTRDKLPYIISLRGSDVPGYNIRLGLDYKILAGIFRKIWISSSVIVANSKGLQNLALNFMPDLDIKIIPNGIDTEKFQPPKKRELSKPIKALTVCRLISRKRINILIEAVSFAKENSIDIKLNIAGEGNLTDELKSLANKLNIAESVEFLGRVPAEKMPQLYRDNDIFLMSSAHEGMSNAMLEAISSGLPIITTCCEGTEELIDDNGIIIENANPESIARAIQTITADKTLYEKMTAAAKRKSESFTWKIVSDKYRILYNAVLDEY